MTEPFYEPVYVKPCPFCGGKPVFSRISAQDDVHNDRHVACSTEGCPAFWGHGYVYKIDAINMWNRRFSNSEEATK